VSTGLTLSHRLLAAAAWLAAVALLAAAPSPVIAAPAAPAKAKVSQSKAKPAAKAKPQGPSRQALTKQAGEYWDAIAAKRRVRIAKRRNNEPITLDDYVLTQPPPIVRRLPPRPPSELHIPRIPVLADFLKAAAGQHGFVPDLPDSELAFKEAYARIATAAGLTGAQAVGIYAFETGGNGAYDVQSGLTRPGPRARAISPAIGYNQLLSTNTVGLLAANGDRYVALLQEKATQLTGDAKAAMERKIAALKRMIVFCRSVPNVWAEHDKLAKGTLGGVGVHAAVLDRDLGPLLQTQKLLDSVVFIRGRGHHAPLTAAELALMNLTGDGNGLDLVTIPRDMRALVPTSNFFQEHGYNRNSIARRTAVVSALFEAIEARMNRAGQLPGAQEMVAAFSAARTPPGSTTTKPPD
jgi:hypothetical protein